MENWEMSNKIFYNGDIVTLADEDLIVEAVGIKEEKIHSVGSLETVKAEMPENSQLIDLNNKALLPGFIDSHLHPIMYVFFLIKTNLSNLRSLEELKSLLREVAKDKDSDELILGLRLMEEKFDNPTLPTRWDLDEACPNNPVFLLRYDGHIGIANTKGLELAGVDNETISPEGGEIRKNESGELTGILSEQAIGLLLSKISFPEPEEIKETAVQAFKNLAAKGLTSLHGIIHADKGGEFGSVGSMEIPIFRTIQDVILQNWYSMVFTERPKKLKRLRKPPLHEEPPEGKFKVNCLKLFIDGTFGAATACMYEPFTDQPDKIGFCVVDIDDLYEQMKEAHNLGFQICVHAIGDKGNKRIVDLFKRLLEEFPRENHRHRIEHASMLREDVIKDIKELGLIVSSQPPFLNSEYDWLKKRIGEQRCSYAYPYKTLFQNGIVMAAGSDCPVEVPDVIQGLHAMVTRNGFVPKECVSIKDALKAYTINGAYAAFEEDVKGTIEKGKLADFVILDKNPLDLKPEEVKDLEVVETVIRGKTVFKK
jgi:hypothetical protein